MKWRSKTNGYLMFFFFKDGRSHATPSKTPPSPSLRSNVPDPKLFPYLSRRLANSGADNCHDVDAATAMLALGRCHMTCLLKLEIIAIYFQHDFNYTDLLILSLNPY